MKDDPGLEAAISARAALIPARIPARIMVVDDDPFIRIVIADALLVTGGTVKTFASGDEAVAAAFQPDLILLDLRMQGMDGRATAQALQKKNPRARTIFLTAEDDARAHDEIMDLGAAGIITKPFDPVSVVDLIDELLGQLHGQLHGQLPGQLPGRGADPARVAQLDAIAAEFRGSLAATMEAIHDAWARMRTCGWQKDGAETILARTHMLAGSAGLFHLHGIGMAADRLEGTLRELLKTNLSPPHTTLSRLEAEIGGLADACRTGALG